MRVPILVGCILLLVFAAAAFGDASIYFDPEDGQVNASTDTIYCTEVWIGPAEGIKGYSVEITYKPADLNFTHVLEGDIFSSAGHASVLYHAVRSGATEDTIAVDASDLTGSASGPGHLFTLCFSPPWHDVDRSPLTIIRTDVRDSNNRAIVVTTRDGSVTVAMPTVPDQSTWGNIKTLYR